MGGVRRRGWRWSPRDSRRDVQLRAQEAVIFASVSDHAFGSGERHFIDQDVAFEHSYRRMRRAAIHSEARSDDAHGCWTGEDFEGTCFVLRNVEQSFSGEQADRAAVLAQVDLYF